MEDEVVSQPADYEALGSWWRDTPEARRLLAIERHKVDVAEATYGLDKRQARRVRRRMGRPIPPGSTAP